jgi:hypothetical protein
MARYTTTDTTLPALITKALSTLQTLVGSTSPSLHIALAAQAAQDAGNTALATTYLTQLVARQAADGNWDGDPLVTALATRAVATAAQPASQNTLVTIPDQALRQAINKALGRNAMDSLTLALLAQLTSLNAVGQGISDLTGLQYAVNLVSVNLDGNNLSNTTILTTLKNPPLISWADNPGNPANLEPINVPAMPLWMLVLLAIGIYSIMITYLPKTSIKPASLHQLCGVLLVLLTLSESAFADGDLTMPSITLKEMRAKGLPPGQLQTIRAIGSNVLQAKRTATTDPHEKDALKQVQAAAQDLISGVRVKKSDAENKKSETAGWDVVASLRHEHDQLQGAGNRPAQKQLHSGGKSIGEQRGKLYSQLADQLDSALSERDPATRLKQLLTLSQYLKPRSSIDDKLKRDLDTTGMHFPSQATTPTN